MSGVQFDESRRGSVMSSRSAMSGVSWSDPAYIVTTPGPEGHARETPVDTEMSSDLIDAYPYDVAPTTERPDDDAEFYAATPPVEVLEMGNDYAERGHITEEPHGIGSPTAGTDQPPSPGRECRRSIHRSRPSTLSGRSPLAKRKPAPTALQRGRQLSASNSPLLSPEKDLSLEDRLKVLSNAESILDELRNNAESESVVVQHVFAAPLAAYRENNGMCNLSKKKKHNYCVLYFGSMLTFNCQASVYNKLLTCSSLCRKFLPHTSRWRSIRQQLRRREFLWL